MKRKITLILILILLFTVTGCNVGTSNLFEHPTNKGYDYLVTYDCLGGNINTFGKRTVYYLKDSLIYEPQGASGMLVAPKFGSKYFLGWYTACKVEAVDGVDLYEFNEEDKWDFKTDRINDENTLNKELTLYARWINKPTLKFVNADNTSETLLEWQITEGNPILRPTSSEPKITGYSLLDYYKDAELKEKVVWGGESGLKFSDFKLENNENPIIYIYCKFIEGNYTRLKFASDLNGIKETDSYILANDIDYNNQIFTTIPKFTGKLIANGYSINNININVLNRPGGIGGMVASEKSFGLFGNLDSAEINDLKITNITITIDASSTKAVCIGALAGRSINTTLNNITIENLTVTETGLCNINITIAAAAETDGSCTVNNLVINNAKADDINTSGNLVINLNK